MHYALQRIRQPSTRQAFEARSCLRASGRVSTVKTGLRLAVVMITMVLVALGCDSTGAGGGGDDPDTGPYAVSGTVTEDGSGVGIEGVEVSFTGGHTPVTTDSGGEWSMSGLSGAVTVTPTLDDWTFDPPAFLVDGPSDSVDFSGTEPGISFAGGDGTPGDPYQVATAAQLNEIRNYLSDHFVLTDDIDLSAYTDGDGWAPIGPTFWGSYDGAGHTISGLFIDRSGDKTGLFAESGGEIQNVTLTGVNITADGNWVGALAGTNSGTIENCTVDGTVTLTDGGQAGGLVGHNGGTITNSESNVAVFGAFMVGGLTGNNSGTIADSFATGPVNGPVAGGSGNRVGGLAGLNSGLISDSYATGLVTFDADGFGIGGLVGTSEGSVVRSYATGNVVASGDVWYIGGLIGENLSEVEDSYATGDVTGHNSVGGFVGLNQFVEAIISRCYSYGAVTATGSNLGGFAGQSLDSSTIEASYWDTDASAIEESAGGEGRTTSQMQAGTSGAYISPDGSVDGDEEPENLMYNGWDDLGVWDFGTATDYPVLR